MSLAKCGKCGEIIDTDEEPETCVEFEDCGYDFLCVFCQEDIDDEDNQV